jgi:mono/diheme cytochrome c family protein
VAAALLALAAVAAPAAASPADAGRELVEEKCVTCHEVDAGTYAGPTPSLVEIAGTSRYWTPTRFEAWLSSSHGPMPQFRVTSQDIYNLMHYLERLRTDAAMAPLE